MKVPLASATEAQNKSNKENVEIEARLSGIFCPQEQKYCAQDAI
jgi:hypothetical protein